MRRRFAMMGRQAGDQSQLFYLFNLERRIPAGHLLRRINPVVTRILVELREKLAPFYSDIGRPSIRSRAYDPDADCRVLRSALRLPDSAGWPERSSCHLADRPVGPAVLDPSRTRSQTTPTFSDESPVAPSSDESDVLRQATRGASVRGVHGQPAWSRARGSPSMPA